MTNIVYVIRLVLTLGFAWFLYKKTAHHGMLKKLLIISGSFFLSTFVITVAWTIIEGFFLE